MIDSKSLFNEMGQLLTVTYAIGDEELSSLANTLYEIYASLIGWTEAVIEDNFETIPEDFKALDGLRNSALKTYSHFYQRLDKLRTSIWTLDTSKN